MLPVRPLLKLINIQVPGIHDDFFIFMANVGWSLNASSDPPCF